MGEMNKENGTSIELSKKFAENGCELDSSHYWDFKRAFIVDVKDIQGSEVLVKKYKEFPVYDILNDICIKYAKEFFPLELLETDLLEIGSSVISQWDWDDYSKRYTDYYTIGKDSLSSGTVIKKEYHLVSRKKEPGKSYQSYPIYKKDVPFYNIPEVIFKFIQQNKKQEAEDYIWKYCIYNPENKVVE